MLIDEGTIIYDGEIERQRERVRTHRTLVVHLGEPSADPHSPGAELESAEGDVARLRFDRNRASAPRR